MSWGMIQIINHEESSAYIYGVIVYFQFMAWVDKLYCFKWSDIRLIDISDTHHIKMMALVKQSNNTGHHIHQIQIDLTEEVNIFHQ